VTLCRASVVDASTSRLDALERLAALSASDKPGEQVPGLRLTNGFPTSGLSCRAHRRPALELGQDLGALSQADDAEACTNQFPVLIPTELASVRDEPRESRSGQDSAHRDVAP
jgi:hypothetical protein